MQNVDIKIHGDIATVLLDRPARRNALNPQLLQDLSTAFSDVHQERRVGSVVAEPAKGTTSARGWTFRFCPISRRCPARDALPEWLTAWRHLTELYEQMLRFPKPIIAAVSNGAAAGAGLGLALAADLDHSLVAREFRGIGSQTRSRWWCNGRIAVVPIRWCNRSTHASDGAADRRQRGPPAWICLPPVASDQIWVAAAELAGHGTRAPREAVQATKRLLNEGIGEALLTQLAAGTADSATACTTDSATEGIRSFLDGREPDWP